MRKRLSTPMRGSLEIDSEKGYHAIRGQSLTKNRVTKSEGRLLPLWLCHAGAIVASLLLAKTL